MEKQFTYTDLSLEVKENLDVSAQEFNSLPFEKQRTKVIFATMKANRDRDNQRIQEGIKKAKRENAKLKTFTGSAAWNRILRDRRKMKQKPA